MKKQHFGDDGKSFHPENGREWKDHLFFEIVGGIDELMSWIGFLISKIPDKRDELIRIERTLFKINSSFFMGKEIDLSEELNFLEEKTKEYWEYAGPIDRFIIPTGSEEVGLIHIARTVCRRVERRVVTSVRSYNKNKEKLIYLNRLSDYLYCLARYINKKRNFKEMFF